MAKPPSIPINKGDVFGLLTAKKELKDSHHQPSRRLWLCKCECGNTREAKAVYLKNGQISSCGCLRLKIRGNLTGEPVRRDPLHNAHSTRIGKCRNPNHDRYEFYGARGINIDERWVTGDGVKSGFFCFLEDMGRPKNPKHTLERKDNDGDYCKANCKWASIKVQANNRRNNHYVYPKIDGVKTKMTIAQVSRRFKLSNVWDRLNRGESINKIIKDG